MRAALILASSAFQEQWRNRAFFLAVLFGALMLYMSLLFAMLAVEQELRVVVDFGLSFIELLALVGAVYGAATAVLREMETKAIYLILSRPVPRHGYLLGRYLGLVLSIASAIGVMALIHLSILLFKGWSPQAAYFLAVAGILAKVAVAAAMAMFLALATTSPLSALTITGILWTLGHFSPELRFMAKRASATPLGMPLVVVTRLIPNLQILNFRDRLEVPAAASHEPAAFAFLYAAFYAAACIALALALFRKKEF